MPPFDKLIKKSRKLFNLRTGRTFHTSFILRRNKILSIGVNSYINTSWFARKNGFKWGYCHSEIDCIKNFQFSLSKLKGTTLVNIRLSPVNMNLMYSHPCIKCLHLICQLDFSEIWFSTKTGFKQLGD